MKKTSFIVLRHYLYRRTKIPRHANFCYKLAAIRVFLTVTLIGNVSLICLLRLLKSYTQHILIYVCINLCNSLLEFFLASVYLFLHKLFRRKQTWNQSYHSTEIILFVSSPFLLVYLEYILPGSRNKLQ